MTFQTFIRQAHRWLGILLTLAILANVLWWTILHRAPPAAITYAPLPPLFLMLASGLYLFFLPYTGKRTDA